MIIQTVMIFERDLICKIEVFTYSCLLMKHTIHTCSDRQYILMGHTHTHTHTHTQMHPPQNDDTTTEIEMLHSNKNESENGRHNPSIEFFL